ncbi:hypothetical protein GCM10027511_09990 [Hymenobacter humi]
MSSIVVLTDSVAHPNRGLAYAAELAGPLQAQLVLLHVRYDELLSHQEYVSNHSTRRADEERKQALSALAESQPVPAEVEISEDFLSDAVAASVRQHQSQLVVLSRPPATAMPTEVVTRVVEDMLRQVHLPLLVVPAEGPAPVALHQLVLAVDSNELALPENVKVIDKLLGELHCKLAIMHVSRAESHSEAAGRRAVYEVRRSGLAALPEEETAHLVCNADAATGILQGADELEADVLVVIARPHSVLGSLLHRSVTAEVIKKSTIPVLVLPALN